MKKDKSHPIALPFPEMAPEERGELKRDMLERVARGLLFPEMTPEEYADLKKDMEERMAKGLPPLERSILLYQGQILDGRHRDKAWRESGIEGNPT
jgi:hypothetical protein